MDISLNGEKVTVTPGRGSKPCAAMMTSYELLAELAGLNGYGPTIVWSTPDGASGMVHPGQRVTLVEGMCINAAVTGAA